jgi:hypothetical protein
MESFESQQNRAVADKEIRDEIDALTPRGWATLSEKRLGELDALTKEMPAYQSRISQQWQRRLMREQLRGTMRAAWISGISGLLGVVLGWILSLWQLRYFHQ